MASDFTVDRASKKYVLGSNGFLKEYANDEPAIEFNADGSYKGVLVEPQSINLCLQSEDFSTTWNNIGNRLTITSNATTAPDGTTTADEIEVTTTGSLRLRQDFTSLTAGDKYTFSFFAKKSDSGNTVTTFVTNTGETVATTKTINLDTFAITNSSDIGITSTITTRDYGNGWIRIQCETEIPAGETTLRVNCLPGSEVSATATGANAFFWGAQLEESPIATSYIPTTTAAVTRLKDDIYLTSASSLIGQTEGTLFVEVDWRSYSAASTFLFAISDGTNANRIYIYNNDSPLGLRMYAISNGSVLTNQGESSTAYSGIQKIAFAYAENDFELYRNGSSISSDTSGSLASLATLTDVDMGQRPDTETNQANMWIRAVALFTTRLSDAECEALTTI